eukprot:TRINITY_DN850_c0_g1_i3.p1 TRINITY_DN850_c0_g1~~TRINITY_DN850_c0_g1_i3.p1  ORF type:complete len:116 (-),score=29.90 TRINITY_DN850_c0_g1_i3:184-531(-)
MSKVFESKPKNPFIEIEVNDGHSDGEIIVGLNIEFDGFNITADFKTEYEESSDDIFTDEWISASYCGKIDMTGKEPGTYTVNDGETIFDWDGNEVKNQQGNNPQIHSNILDSDSD